VSELSATNNTGREGACCGPSRAANDSTAGTGPDATQSGADGGSRITDGLRTAGMVLISEGAFLMGSDSALVFHADGEGPVREVTTSAFWIDTTTVTNADFARFVDDTGYLTEAETFGWSFVFFGQLDEETRERHVQGSASDASWWSGVAGATWRTPTGPGSSVDALLDHPVVHVSWNDAVAFAQWCGKRLPTEAEWERAARGGLTQSDFPWGDELEPNATFMANTWQGTFPTENTAADGFRWTAPVNAFQPNGYGLFNVSGNVWEWTADWFSPSWHASSSHTTRRNPQGPTSGSAKVTKGGSFMCHASYCNRYRLSARSSATPDTSLSHTGFRLVCDA
jgi:formylglycine-generating enzyme